MSEFGDNGEVVLKVKLGQSLHSIIIDQIVKLAIEELGSTEDLVRIIRMIELSYIAYCCIIPVLCILHNTSALLLLCIR